MFAWVAILTYSSNYLHLLVRAQTLGYIISELIILTKDRSLDPISDAFRPVLAR